MGKREVLDKSEIILGFLKISSATWGDETLGEMIGRIMEAVEEYEDYIAKLGGK